MSIAITENIKIFIYHFKTLIQNNIIYLKNNMFVIYIYIYIKFQFIISFNINSNSKPYVIYNTY